MIAQLRASCQSLQKHPVEDTDEDNDLDTNIGVTTIGLLVPFFCTGKLKEDLTELQTYLCNVAPV